MAATATRRALAAAGTHDSEVNGPKNTVPEGAGKAQAAQLPGPSTAWISSAELRTWLQSPTSRSAAAGEPDAEALWHSARAAYDGGRVIEAARHLALAAARGHFQAARKLTAMERNVAVAAALGQFVGSNQSSAGIGAGSGAEGDGGDSNHSVASASASAAPSAMAADLDRALRRVQLVTGKLAQGADALQIAEAGDSAAAIPTWDSLGEAGFG